MGRQEQMLKALISSAQDLGLNVSVPQAESLLWFLDELFRWNKKFNLTAITEPMDALEKHIIDSLTLCPYLSEGRSLIDVGCGAGLPGLVLAIICPGTNITLLDGHQKRIHFVQHVATRLQLGNVKAFASRVEVFQAENRYDIVVSRAFSRLATFCELTKHLKSESGVWIAMKGGLVDGELADLSSDVSVQEVKSMRLPYSGAQRSLVFLR